MGTITGSLGSAGSMTYFGSPVYLNCTCPAGQYPTQITFNDIKSGGAWWKNNSSSAKILDIHLVNSSGTLLAANIMRISITGNGTDSATKTTNTFSVPGYTGQGIYIIGGNATSNVFLQNGTSITVTTAGASYSLTTSAGTGGSLSASPSGYIEAGTTVTLTPTASTGYSFSGYTTNPSVTISNNKFTMPSSNITVTANFTHVVRTLSSAVSPSGGGTVTLGSTTGYYNSTISISATPADGYAFSKWTTTGGTIANANSANTTITMPNANATVTATFVAIAQKKNISFVSGLNGKVLTSSGLYTVGDVIDIEAVPSQYYSFGSWTATSGTIASASSAVTTYTIPNADATVTASFVKSKSAITFATTTGGTVSTSSGNYDVHSIVNISATPSSGYRFNRWVASSGTVADVFSLSTTFIVPDESVTITAYFSEISSEATHSGRYNGTSYDKVIPMYYDGTGWVECEYQRYDGTNWNDVDTQ